MANANYRHNEWSVGKMDRKTEGPGWWPFFGLLAAPGALLFWEAFSPLPQISTQAVSFVALGLLFVGIALWVILLARK